MDTPRWALLDRASPSFRGDSLHARPSHVHLAPASLPPAFATGRLAAENRGCAWTGAAGGHRWGETESTALGRCDGQHSLPPCASLGLHRPRQETTRWCTDVRMLPGKSCSRPYPVSVVWSSASLSPSNSPSALCKLCRFRPARAGCCNSRLSGSWPQCLGRAHLSVLPRNAEMARLATADHGAGHVLTMVASHFGSKLPRRQMPDGFGSACRALVGRLVGLPGPLSLPRILHTT